MPNNHISNKPYHDWLKEDAKRKEEESPARPPNPVEHLLDVIRKCDADSALGLCPAVPIRILDALPDAVKYCDDVRDDFLDIVRQLIEVRLAYLNTPTK